MKYGQEYYFVSITGEVGKYTWENGVTDNAMLEFGNVFKNKDDAYTARNLIYVALKKVGVVDES